MKLSVNKGIVQKKKNLSEFGNHQRGSFITYTCQSVTTYIITVIINTRRSKSITAINIQISVSSIKHNKSGLIENLSNTYTFLILTIAKHLNTKMLHIYKIVSKSQMPYNCAPTRVNNAICPRMMMYKTIDWHRYFFPVEC